MTLLFTYLWRWRRQRELPARDECLERQFRGLLLQLLLPRSVAIARLLADLHHSLLGDPATRQTSIKLGMGHNEKQGQNLKIRIICKQEGFNLD